MAVIPSPSAPGAYPSTSLNVSRAVDTAKSVSALGVLSADPNSAIDPPPISDVAQTALVIGILVAGIVLLGMLVHMMLYAKRGEPLTFAQWWIWANMQMLGSAQAVGSGGAAGGPHVEAVPFTTRAFEASAPALRHSTSTTPANVLVAPQPAASPQASTPPTSRPPTYYSDSSSLP